MATILHITKRQAWDKAREAGSYTAGSLETQGFIHCSTSGQVVGVASFLFRGQPDLVLLCIDEVKVGSDVRYENLDGGQKLFPHVYGPINLDSIVDVLDFPPQADGTFALPAQLRDGARGIASDTGSSRA